MAVPMTHLSYCQVYAYILNQSVIQVQYKSNELSAILNIIQLGYVKLRR